MKMVVDTGNYQERRLLLFMWSIETVDCETD